MYRNEEVILARRLLDLVENHRLWPELTRRDPAARAIARAARAALERPCADGYRLIETAAALCQRIHAHAERAGRSGVTVPSHPST